ncbi:hypothetical protein [Aeromicrobium sp. CF3.5]|uniref:hypothetical protein n=1 Tax=Aeromicrobium sp. CF3.5 TaxID=3373078 RepID=UPI003EE68CAA
MNRHTFRWQGAAFGAFFLAVAGNWAIWQQDLLTQREFSLSLSVVLIVAGILGVILTFWKPRPPSTTTSTTDATDTTHPMEESDEEATDPQP